MSSYFSKGLRGLFIFSLAVLFFSCALNLRTDELNKLLGMSQESEDVPEPQVMFTMGEELGEVDISLPSTDKAAEAVIYWTYCPAEKVEEIKTDLNNTIIYDGPVAISKEQIPTEKMAIIAFTFIPEKGVRSKVAVFYFEVKEEQAAVFINNSLGKTEFSFDEKFEFKVGTNNANYNRLFFAFRGDVAIGDKEMFEYASAVAVNQDLLTKYGSFADDGIHAKLFVMAVACTEDLARCVKDSVVYYFTKGQDYVEPVIDPKGGLFLNASFNLSIFVTHSQQASLKALYCEYSDSDGKQFKMDPCPSKEKPLVPGLLSDREVKFTANAYYPDGTLKTKTEVYTFKKEIPVYYDPIIEPKSGTFNNDEKINLIVSHPEPLKVAKFECKLSNKPDSSFECPTKEKPMTISGVNEKIIFTANAIYFDKQIKTTSNTFEFKVVLPNPTINLVEPKEPPFIAGKDVVVYLKAGMEGSSLLYAIDKDPLKEGTLYDGSYIKFTGAVGETRKVLVVEKYKDGSFSQQISLAITFESSVPAPVITSGKPSYINGSYGDISIDTKGQPITLFGVNTIPNCVDQFMFNVYKEPFKIWDFDNTVKVFAINCQEKTPSSVVQLDVPFVAWNANTSVTINPKELTLLPGDSKEVVLTRDVPQECKLFFSNQINTSNPPKPDEFKEGDKILVSMSEPGAMYLYAACRTAEGYWGPVSKTKYVFTK